MVRIHLIALVALASLLLGCGQEQPPELDAESTTEADPVESEPPAGQPAIGAPRSRAVYVPAYSHLATDEAQQMLLAITLSVRNVDPSASITLTHVDYFDTSGHRVRRYLSAPRRLAPLQTADFSVATLDEIGGSGANFLVYWDGPSDAHPLLTETVMFGHVGNGYVSFSSRGVELDRPPELVDVEAAADPSDPETARPNDR